MGWKLWGAVALAALGSCGARNRASNETQGSNVVDHATLAKLTLTSSAFEDGQPIPRQYSCDGANQSPALGWGEPPAGTKSFALVVDDPDAPGGTFYHWGVYDIPVTVRSITAENAPGQSLANDFGKPGFGPPCPPRGSGAHHYRFKLYGLRLSHLTLKPGARIADLQAAIRQAAVAGNVRTESMLVGYYERK